MVIAQQIIQSMTRYCSLVHQSGARPKVYRLRNEAPSIGDGTWNGAWPWPLRFKLVEWDTVGGDALGSGRGEEERR